MPRVLDRLQPISSKDRATYPLPEKPGGEGWLMSPEKQLLYQFKADSSTSHAQWVALRTYSLVPLRPPVPQTSRRMLRHNGRYGSTTGFLARSRATTTNRVKGITSLSAWSRSSPAACVASQSNYLKLLRSTRLAQLFTQCAFRPIPLGIARPLRALLVGCIVS